MPKMRLARELPALEVMKHTSVIDGAFLQTRKIKLMADYFASPLWEYVPGSMCNIHPDALPISSQLKSKLHDWAATYDGLLDLSSSEAPGFKSRQDRQKFNEIGNQLGVQLRQELGKSFEVKIQVEEDED